MNGCTSWTDIQTHILVFCCGLSSHWLQETAALWPQLSPSAFNVTKLVLGYQTKTRVRIETHLTIVLESLAHRWWWAAEVNTTHELKSGYYSWLLLFSEVVNAIKTTKHSVIKFQIVNPGLPVKKPNAKPSSYQALWNKKHIWVQKK